LNVAQNAYKLTHITLNYYSRLDAKNIPSKLQRLYDAINNFQDVHGRTLSTPFLKLPLKSVSTMIVYLHLCFFSIL